MSDVWHGYALVRLTEAGALQLDEEVRALIRDGVESLNIDWDGVHPATKFQATANLAGDEAMYEVTISSDVTPLVILGTVASALGLPLEQLQAVIEYEVFGEGQSYEVSKAAARAYLRENAATWTEPRAQRGEQ